ncbi:YcgN family cysteine cluster protein [Parashewanella tropica]|uniref:YcgN family cysteine cluster protein n=1 Tax=Parashewanella tropica TaxID=2547970 RepID=UPI00105A1BAB|nr:YcgN family cysteine cluster protein [Parashewanella tropica]
MAFWEQKSLAEMSSQEWESLCDGCGKCCLNKIIDDETDELYYTNAACKLLDTKKCHCTKYETRFDYVPDCTVVTIDNLPQLDWLPDTCAYKRLYNGLPLPSWHPLITGNKKKMHKFGMSVSKKVVNEERVRDIEDHIVMWPLNVKD